MAYVIGWKEEGKKWVWRRWNNAEKRPGKNPAFAHSFLNWPPKIIRWNVSINSESEGGRKKWNIRGRWEIFISSYFSPPSFALRSRLWEIWVSTSLLYGSTAGASSRKKTKILCIINYSQTPLKCLCWRRSFFIHKLCLFDSCISTSFCVYTRDHHESNGSGSNTNGKESQQKCKNKNILVRMGGWEKGRWALGANGNSLSPKPNSHSSDTFSPAESCRVIDASIRTLSIPNDVGVHHPKIIIIIICVTLRLKWY